MSFLGLETAAVSTGFDWRGLYAQVLYELRNGSTSRHLLNARRLWRILGHITNCLVPLLDQEPRMADFKDMHGELQAQGLDVGDIVRGNVRPNPERLIRRPMVGFRLYGLGYIFIEKPASEATLLDIGVSTITFDCTQYICGFRVTERTRSRTSNAVELSRVGLIIPFSETTLTLTSKDHLSSIHVASSVSGITGISFRFLGEENRSITLSAGTVQELPDGVGIAKLNPRNGTRVVGLVVGFDVSIFPNSHPVSILIQVAGLQSRLDTACRTEMRYLQ